MVTKRKISKGSKRRILIFGTISMIVIFYFFVISIQYLFNINRLEKEEQYLVDELLALKKQEEELKTEVKKLKDPDYVARYAREKYLYSKDGEYVIRIDPEETEELIKEKTFNYSKIIGIGTSGLVILYLIMKRRK